MQAHSVLPSTCCRVLSFSEHDSVLLRFIKMRLGAQGIEYSATHLAERRERGAQQTCLLLGTTIISDKDVGSSWLGASEVQCGLGNMMPGIFREEVGLGPCCSLRFCCDGKRLSHD